MKPNDLAAQHDAGAEPEPSITEWVVRARAGDADAFTVLVETHERMVLRTALRLLGRLDLAQDAAQEAFLRFHRHLGRFDARRQVGPWLYRIVVNAARDVGRRAAREATVSLDEVDGRRDAQCVEGDQALDAEIDRARQRERLQAALLALPMKERAAIVLRDIEGLSTAEVARTLGSSEGTVRSQICTGRMKLRRLLRGDGKEERTS